MNAGAQNPKAPMFEIPNPPDDFGQDGGKFYRCYDALAQEIDDDMTSRLKAQLDGMLVFAGLFAGVNTAFLALTIPLLSADPADDTNALLAQNNAILMQLVTRNDTVPTDSTLPSATFSPSHNIFTINALFSLSLAFAIISSFLAVLGRQWLVYYRKRGGGGPDWQRWEQLKRFRGAERWWLEVILDDVLPSLLQIGLIIFCISLVLYLRHLSPAISLVVGIPLSIGLAFFIGSALCTMWDRFCPFHSPLSHLLLWTLHSLSWVGVSMKRNLTFGVPFLHRIPVKRGEESLESLQAAALQRAICISDDPATLLHATANIFAIRDPTAMMQLFNEPHFQQRFLQLVRRSYSGMLQLRNGNGDPKDFAESSRRLYYSAVAHIVLILDSSIGFSVDLLALVTGCDVTTILIPDAPLQDSSSNFIRGNLGLCILWCSARSLLRRAPVKEIDSVCMRDHLVACSEALASCSDLRFLSLFAWIVSRFPERIVLRPGSVAQLREPYRGNAVNSMTLVREAFITLLSLKFRKSGNSLPRETVLINMLRCIGRIVADEQGDPDVGIDHKFKLLEICEAVLRNPQLPVAAGDIGRMLRINVAQFWSREYTDLRTRNCDTNHLVGAFITYIANLRNLDRSEINENIAVAQVFGPMLRRILLDHRSRRVREGLRPVFDVFNAFLSDVHKAFKCHVKQAQDPDERWCHWQEEPLSFKLAQTSFTATRDGANRAMQARQPGPLPREQALL